MVAHELDGDEAALAFLGVLAGFDGYQAVLAVIFVEQVLEFEVVAFCHGVVCCDGAAGVVLIVAVPQNPKTPPMIDLSNIIYDYILFLLFQ